MSADNGSPQPLGRDADKPANSESAKTHSPASGNRLLPSAIVIGLALFSSGLAGLINQVVWQRSLKVFLGGSETICSTVVVLVFMAGLGAGSLLMGRRATRCRNPLKTFGIVEAILAIVNLGVCALLASNVTESVFAVQRIAVSIGVPLIVLYAVLATVVLSVPCVLMGATMPLAAEACQRNLGLRNPRLVGLLFFVNTLGSVLGTVVSSGYMISHLGLTMSLLFAAAMNLVAGLLVLLLNRTRPAPAPAAVAAASTPMSRSTWRPGRDGILAAGLGFCSLAYEMYLFRLVPLRHEPLPFTFSAVLAGFLTFWSIGAALSSHRRGPGVSFALRWAALLCTATIPVFVLDDRTAITGTWSLMSFILLKTPYFLPCILFGYLFGRVAADAAKSWGSDIGRIYAWNTVGSCAGILAMTFVGYELPYFVMIFVIAMLLSALQEYAVSSASEGSVPAAKRRWALPLSAVVVAVVSCAVLDVSRLIPGQRMYSGRDGVIILTDEGDMIWDGLWHSTISQYGNHVGSNNWYTAVCPVLSHPTGDIRDVCVIGTGTGITAGTLSKLSTVERIDSYDICHELRNLYRDYAAGTLHIADDPKIDLRWQDARTGMALDSRKYDLIQTQPLYLIQAGSSLLNSVEFYRLIRSRLKPNGVFCLYSNGSPEQAFAVRETADQVFSHRRSFMNGYLLVLSNDPIDLSESAIRSRLSRRDPFYDEVRGFKQTSTAAGFLALRDQPRIESGRSVVVISDDRPIVEYPGYLRRRVVQAEPGIRLPRPTSNRMFD